MRVVIFFVRHAGFILKWRIKSPCHPDARIVLPRLTVIFCRHSKAFRTEQVTGQSEHEPVSIHDEV
jgi:hypothetical protein